MTKMETRENHLAWCKQRALKYLDDHDLLNAVTSMMSDMDKHPETKLGEALNMLGILASLQAQYGDEEAVRRFIEGFR